MKSYLSGVALAILAAHSCAAQAQTVPTGNTVAARPPAAAAAGPGVQLLLPLIRNGQLFGDVLTEVTPDGGIRYERASLIERLTPMLAESAVEPFAASLPLTDFLTPAEIEASGILLRYDSSLLEIVVERIDPALVATRSLGALASESQIPITLQPEPFSAYLNMVGDFRLEDFDRFVEPGLLLFGAARWRDFVLEFDGGYDRALMGDSPFYRRQARLVYDQVEQQRRWSAGDLQLLGLPVTGGALVGGVAVEKGRRVFTGVGPVTTLGGQQILLDRDATVEVVVDGQQVETLQLTAGTYDLSALTAQYGGRNAQLFVTDVSGRRQIAEFDPFFDPIDLAPGEDEYSAAIGFVARSFRAQPVYGGAPVFSGFYRRGLTNRLVAGAALQLSEDIQVAGGEIVTSPLFLPGRIEFSGALSTGNSTGFAARAGYALQFGRGLRPRQFSINADYRSAGFRTLGDRTSGRTFETFTLNANYSQSFSERTSLVAGVNWFERAGFRSTRNVYADVIHRTPRFRIVAGVEYGSGFFANEFGVRLGITVPLGRRTRADANYNSRRETFRGFVSRSYEDRVGSFGYDVGIRTSPGNVTADAIANYIGNRFYSRATITSSGPDLAGIDQRQDARMQIGTAIAYTGGAVAIGRPINDSFVIASPHESLEGEQVVLGRSVHDRRYDAVSGALGPALGSRLQSYSRQNIIYDLAAGAQGYDIGSGIETVEPPYRSGYRLIVGTDAIVTAFGFLNLSTGRAELVAGTITSPDDPDFGTQPFFTNSAGRFAIPSLRPGRTYVVRLFDPAASYTVNVPEDSDSLLQLGEITIVPAGDEQE